MDYARQRSAAGRAAARDLRGHGAAGAAAGVGVWASSSARRPATWPASPWPSRVALRLALRFDRAVARRYLPSRVPVFVALVAAMVVVQGQMLAFDVDGGLAAVGFVTLAATLSRYVDRADQIVTATIYPAICAIRGQHARARGAVREVQPRDAALGAARLRGRRALRRRPHRLRAGRRVGPGRRADPGAGGRHGDWGSSASTGSRSTARTSAPGRRRSRPWWRRWPSARWRSPGSRSPGSRGFVVGRCAAVAVAARRAGALRPRAAAAACGRGDLLARAARADRRRRPRPLWRCASRCGAQAGPRPRRSPRSRSSSPSSSR